MGGKLHYSTNEYPQNLMVQDMYIVKAKKIMVCVYPLHPCYTQYGNIRNSQALQYS